MVRVVLDTNILISAFFWNGNERKLFRRCYDREFQSITSPDILNELRKVLFDKFDLPEMKINEFLQDILIFSEIVFPKGSIMEVKGDPADNAVLETAILGKADFLITGDKQLLKLGSYQHVLIKRSSEVLE